jgi:hypothetical protein
MIVISAHDPECTVAVYPDMESALKELVPILGEPKPDGERLRWDCGNSREEEDQWNKLMKTHIFKEYYSGCGGCGCIIARELKLKALKTACWDLD